MKNTRPWEAGKSASKAIRPHNLRLPFVIFIITGWLSGLLWPPIIGGLLIIALCYGIVVIINDIADYKIDQANHRDLPLVNSSLSNSGLKQLFIILATTTLGLLLFLPPIYSYVAALYCLIGWAYSCPPFKLSYRGLLAPLTLGLYYAVIPFQTAWQEGGGDFQAGLGISITLLLFSVAYLLYKDFKDVNGDRKFGKHTPLVLYGEKPVKRLSLVFAVAGFAGSCYLGSTPILLLPFTIIGLGLLTLQYRRSQPSPLLLQGYFVAAFGSVIPIIHR